MLSCRDELIITVIQPVDMVHDPFLKKKDTREKRSQRGSPFSFNIIPIVVSLLIFIMYTFLESVHGPCVLCYIVLGNDNSSTCKIKCVRFNHFTGTDSTIRIHRTHSLYVTSVQTPPLS